MYNAEKNHTFICKKCCLFWNSQDKYSIFFYGILRIYQTHWNTHRYAYNLLIALTIFFNPQKIENGWGKSETMGIPETYKYTCLSLYIHVLIITIMILSSPDLYIIFGKIYENKLIYSDIYKTSKQHLLWNM